MKAQDRFRIAIVAPFPSPHATHEGWMTRIASIDRQLAGIQRVYLDFSEHHADFRGEVTRHDRERAEVLLNPSGDGSMDFVSKLAETVHLFYVHTLHLAEYMLPWLNTGKVSVDIHGVTPEEEEMLGRSHLRERYEAVEREVLGGARCCICVSESMAEHYADKYPSLLPTWLTLPICPVFPGDPELHRSPSTDDRRPVALYSGGTQVWQNLDAMLALAESAGEEIDFRFLSHDQATIRRRIEELGVRHPPAVGYCNKAELIAAYRAADFGLVLRDDSPVNRVSCPTKLVEYLSFGLIPVVRSPCLGDFHRFGYAYVTEEEFKDGLLPDSASRAWMIEHNLRIVDKPKAQFEAGTRALREMVQAGAAGKDDHGDRRDTRTPATAPPAGSAVRHPDFFVNLAKADCEEYFARKPAWVTRDQSFLSINYVMGLVKHFKPRTMLEIGVSAGLTSGAMLVASHTYDEDAMVYGIDLADDVYYQPAKKIGALVDEAYPELRSRLRLLLGKTCTDVPDLFEEPIDFVYVDTLHSHPWPTLDVLNSLTRLREGGIIAMDGIRFGAPGHDGSAYFYHHYPGDKLTCDGVQTGAVFVHDRQALFEHCREVLELGWQVDVGRDTLKKTVANVEEHFGAEKAKRVRGVCEARYGHLMRFSATYNLAATIQWEYVEGAKRLARLEAEASAEAEEPVPPPAAERHFHDLRHFRRSVLDRHTCFPCRVLEIGAFSAPTVDPSEAEVKFLDYYATEELRSMARANGADPASVVAVDYVCRTDDYSEVVEESFDVLVANHVLEHVDRTIAWLRMVRNLLRDGGLLFLVLPDKKKSFDRFRPDTPLSHLLYEHLAPEQDVSSVHGFETTLYYDMTYISEENDPAIKLDVGRLAQGIATSHPGVHRHVFQFETFGEKIMKPLLYTGLIDFSLLEIRNCLQFGEFAIVLKAGRDDGPADPGGLFGPATDSLPYLDATRSPGR